jgi:glucokinase
VDIGGTKVLGVALAAGRDLVGEARVATPHGTDPDSPVGANVADAVAQVVQALRRDTGAGTEAPVGVGAPGMLDRRGQLVFPPNLRGATGARFGPLVAERLPGTPVVVENDANCAVLAEHDLGAGVGCPELLLVTLGTGIGGGILMRDRVVLGGSGFAGEIGHMVVDPGGPLCPCGRRGCWERFASGSGLGRLAREAAVAGRLARVTGLAGGDPEAVRGEHVTRAAREGDREARAVFDQLGWWVALGLTNLVAVVDPARILLGGGLAEAGDLVLGPTRTAFAQLVEGGTARPPVEIVTAALGERAGAVGAALAAGRGGL